MLGAVNGLRELRVHRVTRSVAPLACTYVQDRLFIVSSVLGEPAAGVAATTPEAEAAVVAAKKTGRATYWFIGVAAAAVLGTLAYPYLVTLPPPKSPAPLPEIIAPPPKPDPPAAPLAAAPVPILPKISLSPREELEQRIATLQAELTQLRKERRNQRIDMKKRGIKDEINMIQIGMKKLEKA